MQHINATYGAEGVLPALQRPPGPGHPQGRPARDRDDGDHAGIPAGRQHLFVRQIDGRPSPQLLALLGRLPGPLRRVAPPGHRAQLRRSRRPQRPTSGTMLLKGDHFQVDGIPAVPINEPRLGTPTRSRRSRCATLRPTTCWPGPGPPCRCSDEWACAKCHNGDDAESVLATHDDAEDTTFVEDGVPVLCADCHGDPFLGQTGAGSSELYLSQAVHGFHATQTSISCYDCHPGTKTLFHRSTAHTAADGNCTNCHGSMTTLTTMLYAGRIPWKEEPSCVNCHTYVAEVDTGSTLYRDAAGHGGLACAACHGSPRAQVTHDTGRRKGSGPLLVPPVSEQGRVPRQPAGSATTARRAAGSTGSWAPTAAASRRRARSATRARSPRTTPTSSPTGSRTGTADPRPLPPTGTGGRRTSSESAGLRPPAGRPVSRPVRDDRRGDRRALPRRC